MSGDDVEGEAAADERGRSVLICCTNAVGDIRPERCAMMKRIDVVARPIAADSSIGSGFDQPKSTSSESMPDCSAARAEVNLRVEIGQPYRRQGSPDARATRSRSSPPCAAARQSKSCEHGFILAPTSIEPAVSRHALKGVPCKCPL